MLVYADPPYLPETRTKKKLYAHEMTRVQHVELLRILTSLPAMVMLSGYRSSLYEDFLEREHGWNRVDFQAMTRGGVRTESVWMNFKPGQSFHDTRFLGKDYRERERIKRKKQRWITKFSRLGPLDRAVLEEALALVPPHPQMSAATALVGGSRGQH